MPIRIRASKPIRYCGPLPPVKIRISARPKRAAAVAKPAFEEVRGVHVYTYADRTVVSDGIYTTARYAERLAAAGGTWDGSAWTLPAGADVRAVLDPHGAIAAALAAANRPSWTCCSKAKVLSHKNQHYTCPEHTMYYEECIGSDGKTIKILYACSTRGGGCYTGN
jgi:hypothetical protein